MAKKYFWLKLKNDFFTQPKIKKLRRIAGGDTYTIIYLKMQLLSLKNDGRLFYEGIEDDFPEEIALTIDEDPENVRVTVQYLLSQGLMENCSESEYVMTETQNLIGSETDSARRVRKSRERKALQCNTDVTNCNTEIEKEIEIELDKENRDRVNYQQIADMYNATCVSFPQLKVLSDKRKKAIKARLNTYTVEDFKRLFEMAEGSSFLKGANNRNWSATFDWLIADGNMAKVLDGNYKNRADSKPREETREERQARLMREWEEEQKNSPYHTDEPFIPDPSLDWGANVRD